MEQSIDAAKTVILAQVPAQRGTPVPNAAPKKSAKPAAHVAQQRSVHGSPKPSAQPSPRASVSPSPVPAAHAAPLEQQVIGWTWTVLVVIVAVLAVWYGVQYVDALFRAARARMNQPAAAADGDEPMARRRRNTIVIFVLIAMVGVGLVWIPMVPDLANQRWVPLELAAVGILLSGGFVGFLFGLPRLSDAPQQQPAPAAAGAPAPAAMPTSLYRPSTNLEQVVDRIATLLAGVALAQIVAIPVYIGQFALFINNSLGDGHIASAQVLATGILLYFAPLGFVLSFLCTKTIVAPELAHVDETIVGLERSKTVVDDFPTWPDVPIDPTPDQQAAAQRIISVPLSSLTTASQKATWGRAQTLLQNDDAAVLAFQQAQVLTPNDPHLLADYAQTLYRKDDTNAPLALQLAQHAEDVAPADDHEMRARLRNLIAVCDLYVPGGYERAIETVNATLLDPLLRRGERLRYYRACGFGQMWRAIAEQQQPPPDAQQRLDAIAEQILHDTDISLAYAALRDEFVLVTVPTGRAADSHDDDLQAFGRSNAAFRELLGITEPIPEPTTPTPPLPEADPLQIIADSPR